MNNIIDYIFQARSIAVIGASKEPGKFGHTMLKNLLDFGFCGKIYPVNPKEKEILGLKAYQSIKLVDDEVDLAYVLTPAPTVPGVVGECVDKGVKAIIITSSGFGEIDEEGRRIEAEMAQKARVKGIRIIGPNSIGVVSPTTRVIWARPSLPEFLKERGSVAYISQSGGMTGSFTILAGERGIRFGGIVHLGNEADVTLTDLIEYFGQREDIKVIAAFVEGIREGRRFYEVAREVSKRKPICVLKAGRTAKGAEAALSHTGSLAGSDAICDGVFKQAGIQRANDIEELVDFVEAFTKLPLPEGDRTWILTGPGGAGVLAADACEEVGLQLPPLSERIEEELRGILPSYRGVKRRIINPVDMTAGSGWGAAISQYGPCLKVLAKDDGCDMLLVCGPNELLAKEFAQTVIAVKNEVQKPFVIVWMSAGKEVEESIRMLRQNNVVVLPTPQRAARTLKALATYSKFLRRVKGG
jgi:acetyl-CoA synthetase (ADP-forming)